MKALERHGVVMPPIFFYGVRAGRPAQTERDLHAPTGWYACAAPPMSLLRPDAAWRSGVSWEEPVAEVGAMPVVRAHVCEVDGWTIAAWRDRSAVVGTDDLALLLARGSHTLAEVYELAVEHFQGELRRMAAQYRLEQATPEGERRTVCNHSSCVPTFDAAAAVGLSPEEVRRHWPRFYGPCPDCGASVLACANSFHCVAGGW